MTRSSRIIVALASLGLLLVFVFPLWRIDLQAPQYPEGLGLVIRVNTVEGVKPNDLRNINNLNHYIGMKTIEPDSIPELRFMPWIVVGLVAFGLLVAATGRRSLLYVWLGALVLLAVAGLADFWKWQYDFGHNLDEERAIIKVPGMTYQPPLIGSKQLLNFVATSWPGPGTWAALLSGALGFFVLFREGRRAKRPEPAAVPARRTVRLRPIPAEAEP